MTFQSYSNIGFIVTVLRSPIKLELKRKLYGRGAVGFDEGDGGVGLMRVEIVDDDAEKGGTVLVFPGFAIEIDLPVPGALHQGCHNVVKCIFVVDAIGAGDVVLLKGEVDLDAEA